jgi:hypothetical protein
MFEPGLFVIAFGVAALFGFALLLEVVGPLVLKKFSRWG